MKNLFSPLYTIIPVLCVALIIGSCSYESDTVNPGDISDTNASVPPGDISLSVTTVSTVDISNTYVTIIFNNMVDVTTIDATSLTVVYNGSTETSGVDYSITYLAESPNRITITFLHALTATLPINITLTNGILALADGSGLTNPGTWNLTVATFP